MSTARRTYSPILNGDAANHPSDRPNAPRSSGLTGKFMKLLLFLAIFAATYYVINVKEKDFIMSFGNARSGIVIKVVDDEIAADVSHKDFILKPREDLSPAIVWLMSFPNSGTSYTMTMVARSSNRSFATNYCDEVIADDEEECHSLYSRRPEGPFWAGKSGKTARPRELPDKYVITKTHCGSRCVNCGPDQYIETPEYFLRRCATGHARAPPNRQRVDVEYPPERVAKAIHLIRNPFHNIIARYHLEHKHRRYRNETEWLQKHGNDKDGLQKHCKDLDMTYKEQDEDFFGKDGVPKAPCHGEFYKWTQWHNLVHEGLKKIETPYEVPVLTVYYEDYSSQFRNTVKRILGFLELVHEGELKEFSARSDYDGYFSEEQQEQIKELVKSVASEKTWSEVKHYFD